MIRTGLLFAVAATTCAPRVAIKMLVHLGKRHIRKAVYGDIRPRR